MEYGEMKVKFLDTIMDPGTAAMFQAILAPIIVVSSDGQAARCMERLPLAEDSSHQGR